LFTHVLE